ncbi:MAG: tetratricopeptide repeat protein [Planctomycetota bacterium]|nr:tetratricopeptide repeat protein [Planctomycetota bacterium]
MKRSSRINFALWAAVIGLPIVALGQQRVGSDGHALDASNQIGSGGVNTVAPPQTGVTGNQILTGNVTNGFQFRGRNFKGVDLGVGYTDPTAWRGLLPGMMVDQFVRQSAGVPTAANPIVRPATGAQPFYPQATTIIPPAGFVQQSFGGGGYLPAATISSSQINNTSLNPIGPPTSPLPRADELFLPGLVDTSADTMFSASPLYGIRQLGSSDSDNLFSPDNTNGGYAPTGPVERDRADQQRIQQLRQELNQSASPVSGSSNNAGGAGGSVNPNGPRSSSGNLITPVSNGGQPLRPILNSGAQPIASVSLSPVAGQVGTMQSTRQYLSPQSLPPASEQSAQVAELRRRLEVYNNGRPKTDEEANREFISALQASRAVDAGVGFNRSLPGQIHTTGGPMEPGTTGMDQRPGDIARQGTNPYQITGNDLPGQTPALSPLPGTIAPLPPSSPNASGGSSASSVPPAPMQIGNLEEGVRATGLKNLISQGEDFVEHQQYAKAIDVYDQAIQVAPNNPLLLIGRSEAELGGSFYRQAESDLRSAFRGDQAVLMGQFDLQKHLGDTRLAYIVSDLKQIASEDPTNATPVFLLAYVAYNTHHEAEANSWLDVANKRTDGKDDVIPLLKRYWTFTAPATRPDNLNK